MKLIVIALEEEISSDWLKKWTIKTLNHTNYYFDQTNEFAITFCDVGKVNATYHLTKAIYDLKNIEYIINIGTAGAISKHLNVFDLCIVRSSQFLDVDLYAFGYELNQMRSFNKIIELDKKLINKLLNVLETKNCVKVGTSDSFISKQNYLNYIDINNIDLVDMELCALSCVAQKFKLKMCAIKVVSDNVHNYEMSVDQYQKNQVQYQKIICDCIGQIIQKLN